MRIAQVSPLYEAVPPLLYGGTERIVAYLSDALVDLGHDVTLFASADSCTRAKLHPVRDRAIRLDPASLKSDVAAHLTMLDEIRNQAYDFDVIHFHIDLLHMPIFDEIAHRTLTTLHGRLDLKDLPSLYRRWPTFPLVSISNSHRKPMTWANWIGTVHHGLPVDLHRPPPEPAGDYLAFLGRMSPEKGPVDAIMIARELGMPIRIAAKVDPADQAYFREVVSPHLEDPHVEFVGEISEDAKSEFLGNARALLFPINWPEPFGLVMIEAMAAGTPVVAYRHGSVPEIVSHGKTGFVVGSVAEAARAVTLCAGLDRTSIRRDFERRFTAGTMAEEYLKLYRVPRGQRKRILYGGNESRLHPA
jgi:glycosyltransferase involved in cell wall biosynthesis